MHHRHVVYDEWHLVAFVLSALVIMAGAFQGDSSIRGDVFSFSEVNIVTDDYLGLVASADPSRVQLRPGEISVKIHAGSMNRFPECMMRVSENKTLDIVAVGMMEDNLRGQMVNITEVELDYESDEAIAAEIQHRTKLIVIMMAYLIHGSLGNLGRGRNIIPKYFVEAFGIAADEFKIDKLASYRNATSLKFKSVIRDFVAFVAVASDTLKSRLMQSVGGNRIFSIIKAMLDYGITFDKSGAILKLLSSPVVLDMAPFISFHPDHDRNPTSGTGKNLMRALGTVFSQQSGDVDKLQQSKPSLFIPEVVQLLKENINIQRGDIGVIEEYVNATQPEYSVKNICNAVS